MFITHTQINALKTLFKKNGFSKEDIDFKLQTNFNVKRIEDLTQEQAKYFISKLQK